MGPTSETTKNSISKSMHVAFGVDENYFRGMAVNIVSIIKNNLDLVFYFHVFAFSVSDDTHRRLQELEKDYDISITIHLVDENILSDFYQFPCFSQHSLATFIRILIPNLLKGVTDNFLYLDADILCLGKIEELFTIKLGNSIAAVVMDEAKSTVATQISTLELQYPEYFNAGVMFINIPNWINNDSQHKALHSLSIRNLRFADQDALNIALNGNVTFINEKWNFRYHLVDFLSNGITTFEEQTRAVFMHFTGPVKPWHNWCLHEVKTAFLHYQSFSPWMDVPLDKPDSTREFKLFSKFLIRQRQVIPGVYWHAIYLLSKLKNQIRSKYHLLIKIQ